jgi:hypothetical protein
MLITKRYNAMSDEFDFNDTMGGEGEERKHIEEGEPTEDQLMSDNSMSDFGDDGDEDSSSDE